MRCPPSPPPAIQPHRAQECARVACQQLGISDWAVSTAQLAAARSLVGPRSYYIGTMAAGDFTGRPVTEAKPIIYEQLVQRGIALVLADPPGSMTGVRALLGTWGQVVGEEDNELGGGEDEVLPQSPAGRGQADAASANAKGTGAGALGGLAEPAAVATVSPERQVAPRKLGRGRINQQSMLELAPIAVEGGLLLGLGQTGARCTISLRVVGFGWTIGYNPERHRGAVAEVRVLIASSFIPLHGGGSPVESARRAHFLHIARSRRDAHLPSSLCAHAPTSRRFWCACPRPTAPYGSRARPSLQPPRPA